jgi:hypothetical protein
MDLQEEGLIGKDWDMSLGGYPVRTGMEHK